MPAVTTGMPKPSKTCQRKNLKCRMVYERRKWEPERRTCISETESTGLKLNLSYIESPQELARAPSVLFQLRLNRMPIACQGGWHYRFINEEDDVVLQ